MNVLRRMAVGAVVFALMAAASLANAQALRQLPADALAVIKLNNPQAVSQKLAQLSEKMGVAKIQPELADPLGWLQKESGLKAGFDVKGEVVLGVYAPAKDEAEPRVVALIPVTDYTAFMGNMKNVKAEGEISSFNLPDDVVPLFAANRGGFAAISMDKDLISKPPAGMQIVGASLKQLDSNDIAVYGNVKLLAQRYLPDFRKAKAEMVQQVRQSLKDEPTFNQKFAPLVIALVEHALNLSEGAMESVQGATLGLALSKDGINSTFMFDFAPGSQAGQSIVKMKNSGGNLLAGLPNMAYLAYGGAVLDPTLMSKIVDDILGPVPAELQKIGPESKPIVDVISATRMSLGAVNAMSFGYVMPSGDPGKQSAVREIAVYRGDSQKLADAQRQSIGAATELLKLLPKEEAAMISVDMKRGAKTVDGAAFDQLTVNFKLDDKAPETAQIAQVLNVLYGGNGVSGYMGAVDDKTYVMVMGGEDLLAATVTAARQQAGALGDAPAVKLVDGKLPQQRVMAYYIAVDNIVNTVGKYVNAMGMPFSVKFPTGQPPIGVTISTEESAVRLDSHVPADLIQNAIAVVLQAMMGGGQNPAPIQ